TLAAKLEDDVPNDVKNRRLNQLLAHQKVIAEKRYRERVGRVMEVLVEGPAKNKLMNRTASGAPAEAPKGRVWTGRTGCGRVVNFLCENPRPLTGRFLEVKITHSSPLSLSGELPQDPFPAEERA